MFKKILVAYLVLVISLPSSYVMARTLPSDVLKKMSIVAPAKLALPQAKSGDLLGDVVKAGGATLTKSESADSASLTIDQETAKLLLEWASFDIGENATVRFNQDADATAVNVIDGATPSRIFGRLIADGQVYLLNQNGIIFGKNSQVNVRGLVAAAAKLNGYDDVSALTDQQKVNFLQDSLLDVIGEDKAFLVIDDIALQNMSVEDLPRIVVQQGASIESEGVPILLAGPEVVNEGSIRANNSQVVLAGSRKEIFLAVSDNDDDLRGYLVEVNSGDGERGVVENSASGSIVSALGNVTLVANEIIQNGKIKATSAVDANGSIRILARDQAVVRDVANPDVWPAVYFRVNDQNRILNNDDASPKFPTIGKVAVGTEGGTLTLGQESVTEIGIKNLDDQSVKELINSNIDVVGSVLAEHGVATANDLVKLNEADQITILSQSIAAIKNSDNSNERISDGFQVANLFKYATDSVTQKRSMINLEGKNITLESGSVVRAKGGTDDELTAHRDRGALITLRARENAAALLSLSELNSEASIVIEENAIIDASGTTDTVLPASRNTLEFFVTSNDVKDNAEQKGGNLLRETVSVDIREGTELFDWQQGVASIEKSASERSAHGGRVEILATGAVSIEDNATIDVSGGKVQYQAGEIITSKVIQNGKLIDIADANARGSVDDVIDINLGTAVDEKWGERESFSSLAGLLVSRKNVPTYNEGFGGGEIEIIAPKETISASANFNAGVTAGLYQRSENTTPQGGNVVLDMQSLGLATVFDIRVTDALIDDDFLGVNIYEQLIEESDAGLFVIRGAGDIEVSQGASIDINRGRSIALEADSISINGNIRAVSGDVDVVALDTVDITGDIDVSGGWTNKRMNLNDIAYINAGDVTVYAEDSIRVWEGSRIRANAGAMLSTGNDVTIGKAGNIGFDLASGIKPGSALPNDTAQPGSKTRQAFVLEGEIEAIDNQGGGSLSFVASDIEIGGVGDTSIVDGTVDGATSSVYLSDDFFRNTNVGHFSVEAREGNLVVNDQADIKLSRAGYKPSLFRIREGSNQDASVALQEITLPEYEQISQSIALKASTSETGSDKGSVVVKNGAKITGANRTVLNLAANESIFFDGEFSAKGGQFKATLQAADETLIASVNDTIVLGDNAVLDLSAGVRQVPGQRSAGVEDVVEAGSVDLNAEYGYVFVKKGADINLSGSVVNVYEDIDGQPLSVPMPVKSGDFTISAESGFALGASVNFGESDQGYRGGSLVLNLDPNQRGNIDSAKVGELSLVLGDTAALNELSQVSGDTFVDSSLTGQLANLESEVKYKGVVAADNLNNSYTRKVNLNVQNNLENTDLKSKIVVSGDTSIGATESIYMDTPTLDLQGNQLDLAAAYVRLGESSRQESQQSAIDQLQGSDSGTLNVTANLIDLNGNFHLAGDGEVNFTAKKGIQLRSVYNSSFNATNPSVLFFKNSFKGNGNINFKAPNLWASTLADFSIEAGKDFTYSNYGSNTENILSAGAKLGISAKNVMIDSVVSVPYGELSVSATDDQGVLELGKNARLNVSSNGVVPFGRLKADDFSWVYRATTGTTRDRELNFDTADTVALTKIINLEADRLIADPESVLNVAGSGTVYGREFVAGLEGTIDVLSGRDYTELFAIVPAVKNGYAAFDAQERAGTTIEFGTQFEVSGSDQVADGMYTVLPANYGLMPGAYLVSPADVGIVKKGYNGADITGAEVVSGRFNYQGSNEAKQWSGFAIEPNSVISKLGDYRITDANQYYSGTDVNGKAYAPGTRPMDNGGVSLVVGSELDLQATIATSSDSNSGSYLDIASPNSVFVGESIPDDVLDPTVLVKPELFDRVNAGSILVGGNRQWNNGQWRLQSDSLTSRVTIRDSDLGGQEIVLVAAENIALINSNVVAQGEPKFVGNEWSVDGAEVGVLASNSAESHFDLNSVTQAGGSLDIDTDSSVSANGSVGLLSDGSTAIEQDTVNAQGGNLQVYSQSDLVLADGVSTNGNFAAQILESASGLDLKSANSIVFGGDTSLSLNSIKMTTNEIRVAVDSSVDIAVSNQASLVADSVMSLPAGNPEANSNFSLAARIVSVRGANSDTDNTLVLAADNVAISADEYLEFSGYVSVLGGGETGAILFDAPVLGSLVSGTKVKTHSRGLLSVKDTADAIIAEQLVQFAPGGRFEFSGNDVLFDSTVVNKSGVIALRADNDMVLGDNAKLDVEAYKITFPGDDAVTQGPAGQVSLVAGNDLTIKRTSSLYFGGSESSSDEGAIKLVAGNQLDIVNADELAAGAGGVDLLVQAGAFKNESSTADNIAEWEAMAFMNQAGMDGVLDITVSGIDTDLTVSQDLKAENLHLTSVDGELNISSAVDITSAKSDPTFYGKKGVTIGETASVTVRAKEDDEIDLSLQTETGVIDVAAAAKLDISGGLALVVPSQVSADSTKKVRITDEDRIQRSNGESEIKLYGATYKQDNNLTKADYQHYEAETLAALGDMNPNNYVELSAGHDATVVSLRPYLDVSSTAEMNIGSQGSTIDYSNLMNGDDAGRLLLRSQAGVNLLGGISAGVRRVQVNLQRGILQYASDIDDAVSPLDILVLSDQSSADVHVVSGAFAGSSVAKSDQLAQGDITLFANSFMRTGTGNISVNSAGNLQQQTGSYIAALGKSYSTDALGFPSMGDYPFFFPAATTPSMWKLDNQFSGFGIESGDVNVNVAGDLIADSRSDTMANYMHRYIAQDDAKAAGSDFGGMRAWFAAIDDISGGIQAIGGGNVAIKAGGDIENSAFATPGVGVWVSDVAGPMSEGELVEYSGGRLSVDALGDISGSSFQNDGGSISVVSRGSIAESADKAAALFIASDSTIAAQSAGDLIVEGIINTTLVPMSGTQFDSIFGVNSAGLEQYFFKGYDDTKLALNSVSGDVRLKTDFNGSLDSFYGQNFVSNYDDFVHAHNILPSQVAITALSGQILLDARTGSYTNQQVLPLFPSSHASLSLKAYGDIKGNEWISSSADAEIIRQNAPILFYLSDFESDALASIDKPVLGSNITSLFTQEGKLIPAKNSELNHSSQRIDRSAAGGVNVVSATGNIGSESGGIAFNIPMSMNAYAGDSFINSSFYIQHNNASDVTSIVAKNDFIYPLLRDSNGLLNSSDTEIIRIAGPGDLIIQAGGDIGLGTSRGIFSIGNEENSVLSATGANIHLLAGVGDFDNQSGFNQLVGNAVESNAEIALFGGLFTGDQLEQASFVDWFNAFSARANGVVKPDQANYEQYAALTNLISSATGEDYSGLSKSVNVASALQDYSELNAALQQRLAVSFATEVVMSDPGKLVAGADQLFNLPEFGSTGLGNGSQRTQVFQDYFSSVGSFIALDYLQNPTRLADLFSNSDGVPNLAVLSAMPAYQQLALATQAYQTLDTPKQLLVAEQIMLQHNKQSGIEGASAGSLVGKFERGYVAQRFFFGEQNDFALKWMDIKYRLLNVKATSPSQFNSLSAQLDQVERGVLTQQQVVNHLESMLGIAVGEVSIADLQAVVSGLQDVESIELGGPGNQQLTSIPAMLTSWQQDAGVNFDYDVNAQRSGGVDLRFSSVQTLQGGNINILTPSGSANVGSSAALVKSLFGEVKENNELGLLTYGIGDINAVVADSFNVNQSRAIPLSGGDINLWSAFGDIDAGKGSKTAEATAPTKFIVDPDTGGVVVVQPPSVAGSGIQTKASRSSTTEALTPEQRYYQVAEGLGATVLVTPLGIVDAGEAGIQSAGDLYLAAAQVRGADNISAGGISTGIPTTTAIGSDIGGLGSAVDAATESVQSSAEKAVSEGAGKATAFVTIELL